MSSMPHPLIKYLKGLYAIADTSVIGEDELFERIEQVLRGGCRVIQYRDKTTDLDKRIAQASGLLSLCREYDAVFIVNDDVELAITVNAPGVHVGRQDSAIREIKKNQPQLLVGASCYNNMQIAEEAVIAGADYIAFGSFFPSSSKPEATPASKDTLKRAKEKFDLPVVAIGGIMADNAPGLISCGADAVAMISGVFSTADPYLTSMKISELFPKHAGQAR